MEIAESVALLLNNSVVTFVIYQRISVPMVHLKLAVLVRVEWALCSFAMQRQIPLASG